MAVCGDVSQSHLSFASLVLGSYTIGSQLYSSSFYDTVFVCFFNLDVKMLLIDVIVLCVFCDSVLSLLYVPGFE